ncbi:cupin domain-containing protein [Phreatobacter sp.]|uniref:cupin domain-containing protein n=1 Tax=Phreatobacter sp. TaxID=1966341 RepID=UPI003F70677A
MHINRFADLKPYEAPGHHGMRMLRMQGREAGPSEVVWLGVSQILPGGGVDPSASAEEKFYVVLEGELTVETASGSARLGPWDSCRIAPDEVRALKNETNRTVTVLLAMPLPGVARTD